jgi:tetratricopeptide (TPR) repeat protein
MREHFPKSRKASVIVCFVLFVGTALLFSRAVNHEFIDLDDPDYVTANTHVQSGFTWTNARWAFTSGDASNWHPLTWLSHMLDWKMFGKNPAGHHATNIVLHSFNAVLVFLVLRRLIRRTGETESSPESSDSFWPSAVCAALFAWHPLRVESVAWVSERKDVLSVFFALLTIRAYWVYSERRRTGRGAKVSYVATLVTFAAGLMCKPMLVTLPFALLLLDFWPLRRFAIDDLRFTTQRNASPSLPGEAGVEGRGEQAFAPVWFLALEKIPLLALSAGSCIVTFLVQQKAGAVVTTIPLSDRLANAVVSIVRYLGKFFWPFDLAIGYPAPAHWPFGIIAASVAFVFGMSLLAIFQCRSRPWLFVGWFWFLGMLVPVVGIVQVGLQSMADRYSYLPMLGLQIAIVWAFVNAERGYVESQPQSVELPSVSLEPETALDQTVRCGWSSTQPRSFRLRAPAGLSSLLAVFFSLVACIVLTSRQLSIWQNSATLYEHALAVTHDNYLAESYLGTALLNKDQFTEAAAHFRKAIGLKPNYIEANYRLALALDKMDQRDAAMTVYERVLQINPGYGIAHHGLGSLLLGRHQASNALTHFEAALKIKPDHEPSLLGVGSALAELGKPEAAVLYFEKALVLNATNAVAHFNYANALSDMNRFDEALRRYQRALDLDPKFEEAHCNAGNSLRALGRLDEAVASYRRALKLQPQDATAHYGLGAAQEDLGHIDDASASYNEAIRLQPDYADAHYNLGALLLNSNRADDAAAHFKIAARLQPAHDMTWLGLGLAAAQLGKQPEAIRCYERALAIAPSNAPALCCIGVALRRQDKLGEAIPYYERALGCDPDYVEAHAELGNALYRSGRTADAIPHLERALKLHPDFPGISDVLARARHSALQSVP